MAFDLKDELLRLLPGGEWTNPQVVDDGVGMMANRAVRATAVWARKEMPVFLKCIPTRRLGAGANTAVLTDPDRLENIRVRLERARVAGGPLVALHCVEWLGDRKWLLIAMDAVTPLNKKIASTDVELAMTVLRTLDASNCKGWFHFDICPGNTGITKDGRVVFIDPESYLELTRPNANISLGLAKWFRLSPALKTEIENYDDPESLPADLAERKHNFEVVLLSAECCLGAFNRTAFVEADVRDWCANAPASPALRDFWLPLLLDLCAGRIPSTALVADGLKQFVAAADPVSRIEAAPLSKPSGASAPQVEVDRLTKWEEFEPIRRAMRERRLNRTLLAKYRAQMEKCASADPSRRDWWAELLMISLVFDIDPAAGARFAATALTHHPDDPEFVRDRQIAQRWRDA